MTLRKQHSPITKFRRLPERDARRVVSDLQAARIMARAWGASLPDRTRQQAAWSFIRAAIDAYVEERSQTSGTRIVITAPSITLGSRLAQPAIELARTIGREAANLPIEHACYQISATYTVLVSDKQRSELGMYYTPPALSDRLLDMAEAAGVDWRPPRCSIRLAGEERSCFPSREECGGRSRVARRPINLNRPGFAGGSNS